MTITAIYPGTFDPITDGHVDLIERASKLFGKVVVAIAENSKKTPLFSLPERICLAEQALGHLQNIEVHGFNVLLTKFAQSCEAKVILRGLRAVSDFEFEFQLAWMNRRMAGEIETLFLMPAEKYAYISSTLVKEIASLGGNVEHVVPPGVNLALKEKYSSH